MAPVYRMPLGYGPTPGPRQTSIGKPVADWDKVDAQTCTIVFQAPYKQLQELLPHPCFTLSSTDTENIAAEASFRFTSLSNLPWLAGRGYNLCGLYIHGVTCEGATETVEGDYLSVLFENLADPIVSGREELGYPKVYASLDEDRGGALQDWALKLGWEGTTFGRMRISNLSTDARKEDPHTTRSRDILCFKHIPKTGSPGVVDVQYPTVSPSPPLSSYFVRSTSSSFDATLEFEARNFEELPTLHHITAKLADLTVLKYVRATVDVVQGASDYSQQRPILI